LKATITFSHSITPP